MPYHKPDKHKTLSGRELKAIMLTLGLTGVQLAERAHVDQRNVRRWLSDAEPAQIPQGVIDEVITPEVERQEEATETALEIVEAFTNEHGDPAVIKLPFYSSTSEVQATHARDTRTAHMANMDSIRIWAALKALGCNVEFTAPSDTEIPIEDIQPKPE